ncbi:MAG TPA: trigger factor [Candidatus Acidoferrales bacterium]|nr:trigger factor [Candidatus Acidoferrales bacterium]
MDYKIIDLGGLKKQLEVTATLEDEKVKTKLESAYNEFQQKAVIPGFRKGKTPIEIVKKRFGEEIESESLPEIVNDVVKEIFEKENTKVAGVVDYNLDSRKSGEPLHFRLTFEVVPEIEPAGYKEMRLERSMYKILPQNVEHELMHIREANAEKKEVEHLDDEKGMVTVDLQVIDAGGLPLIGQRRENYKIDLRRKAPELAEIQARLLKGNKGDEFNIELETFDKDGKQGGKKPFRVFVKTLEKFVLPDLTDEFAKKISGGKMETLAALKDDIERELEHYYEDKAEEELRDRIAEELLKTNEFEIPESMVEDYLNDLIAELKKQSGDQEVDEGFVKERYREAGVRAVKWNLLAAAIIQKEGLKVDESILERTADDESTKYNIDKGTLIKHYRQSDDVKNKLLFNEMFNFIINNAEVKVVEKNPTHEHED